MYSGGGTEIRSGGGGGGAGMRGCEASACDDHKLGGGANP